MSPSSAIPGDGSGIPARLRWLSSPYFLLSLMAALIVIGRLYTFHEPTDRDLACYAVTAHEILNGERLYDGFLLDQKPPGAHVTYGLAELLVGYGRQQIFLLAIAAAIGTLLATYYSAKVFSPASALWAVVFWTLISGHLQLEANQPNTEVFINLWTVLGIGVLLRAPAAFSARTAILAGIFFALASFYKHVVVLMPLFIGIAWVAFPKPGKSRLQALGEIALLGLVGIVSWGMLFGYFAWSGRLASLWECLFEYNRHYSGNLSDNLSQILALERLFPAALEGLGILFLLALFGIVLGIRQRNYSTAVLLIALAISSLLAIALPGHFYPHYYQLWFPFLLLGSACGLAQITQFWRNPGLTHGLAAIVAIILLFVELPSYAKSPMQWSQEKYGDIFVITDGLAHEIRGLLKPDESFYQLGSETQLYFDTQRRPPGTLSDYGVFSGPLSEVLSARNLQALTERPPDLLLVEKYSLPQISPQDPLLSWIQQNYEPAPSVHNRDPLFLFVKKGSALEQRLQAGSAQPE